MLARQGHIVKQVLYKFKQNDPPDFIDEAGGGEECLNHNSSGAIMVLSLFVLNLYLYMLK